MKKSYMGCKYCPYNLMCDDAYKPIASDCNSYDQTQFMEHAAYGNCSCCGEVLVPELIENTEDGRVRTVIFHLKCPECGAVFAPNPADIYNFDTEDET